jgi:hypothetical protein
MRLNELLSIEDKKKVWGDKPRSVAVNNPLDFIQDNKQQLKIALERYKKGCIIYRIPFEKSGDDAMLSDPTVGTRVSANTLNYYTWIIDNSPDWKDYPKRSKSLICASFSRYDNNEYIVLPFNNPIIGTCPEYDMWYSFNYLKKKTKIYALPDLNNKIQEMLFLSYGKEVYTSYEDFYRDFSNIDKSYKDSYPEYFKEQNPYKTVESWLNPEENGFIYTNLSSYNRDGIDAEVWFSEKALLIKKNILDQYIKDGKI